MPATRDFTQGSITKSIFLFGLPIFIGMFLQQAYQMVDSIVVGRFLGHEALAAVSVSNTVVMVVVILMNGLASGIGISVAQLFGARRTSEIKDLVYSVSLPLAGLSVLVSVSLVVFAEPFLRHVMGAPEEVMPEAVSYFRIYMASLVFVCLYNVLTFSLRALGNSKVPVYFLALFSVLNALLDLLFVPVLGLGIAGAGWATFISQGLATVLTFRYAVRKVPELNLLSRSCRFDRGLFSLAMRYGLPNALQQMALGASSIFMSRLINSFGAMTMAANGAVERMAAINGQCAQSFSSSLSSFAAQNAGAGNYRRIARGLRVTLALGTAIGAGITLLSLLFPEAWIRLFISVDEAGGAETVRQGVSLLRMTACSFVFIFINYIAMGMLRGAGDTAFTSAGTVAAVALRIVAAYMLAAWTRLDYLSIGASAVVMGLVGAAGMLWRCRSGRWRSKSIAGKRPSEAALETEL